jgi:hypothetical protein
MHFHALSIPITDKFTGRNLEELVNKWGDIVMPRKMTTATIISLHFHAPWGAAFKRLEESGWKV